ncbi:hypothetical protein ABNF97_29125 [Plantactinospora sp. B6F1]|uniref:hypothetical protein n=1 Tax=Plantactinospora sp. B6F1 TaxID=3158971 RepID=UPI0032D99B08
MPDRQVVSVRHEQVVGADYSRRTLDQFVSVGSTFTDCRFDRTRINDAGFGAGMEQTEFVDCSFDGTSLRAVGGFTRFVRCAFRSVRATQVAPDYLEFVDCTFSGRITGLRFWGGPPNGAGRYAGTVDAQRGAGSLPMPPGYRELVLRERNQIHGNDFSNAQLVKVEFRFGVDLTAQKLPVGEDYVYVPDPETTVSAAVAELGRSPSEYAPRAQEFLISLMQRSVGAGQRQLWIRPKDFERKGAVPTYIALAADTLRHVQS